MTDPRQLDPADFETHGEDGSMLPAQLRPPLDWTSRRVPWEEAVEWTFAPMQPPPTEGDA